MPLGLVATDWTAKPKKFSQNNILFATRRHTMNTYTVSAFVFGPEGSVNADAISVIPVKIQSDNDVKCCLFNHEFHLHPQATRLAEPTGNT